MHLGGATIRVRQVGVCREGPAYGRNEVPLGGGNGWKCEREQYPGCKTRQNTREHYVTSLRKSVAKSDLVTLPAGSWNVALKPSLFARRMKVILRSGSFSRSEEYALPTLPKCQTTRSLRWL